MKFLDTTFLIDFLKGNKDAREKAHELRDQDLATTSQNIFEVLVGIHRKKSPSSSELDSFEKMLGSINVFDFDIGSSHSASKIAADLINQGKEIDIIDCLVAGTVLSKNHDTIVTRDMNHFSRIKEIKVEKY